ncbi:MAG: type I 3-dehydroquinate dehydratase [Deferribacteres bacterium]|nr:type I 3-dehydroquinate dehydratase [Deferribacteres bacterium]
MLHSLTVFRGIVRIIVSFNRHTVSKMKIGDIELGKRPVVVGTVSTDFNMPADAVQQVDIMEIRVDMLDVEGISDIIDIFSSVKRRYGKPLIATIRSREEGGEREIDDDRRYRIFREVLSFAEVLDVELSSGGLIEKVSGLCRENGRMLMASYHNFSETPERDVLMGLLRRGKDLGARIVKIAVHAADNKDLSELIHFTIENRDAGIVTISLGRAGLISRIINPMTGSLLTYGFIDRAASPGQISAFEIIKHLRLFDPSYNEAATSRVA